MMMSQIEHNNADVKENALIAVQKLMTNTSG